MTVEFLFYQNFKKKNHLMSLEDVTLNFDVNLNVIDIMNNIDVHIRG